MRCHPESGVVAVRLRSHWMRTMPFGSHQQCAGERNIFLFWAMVLRKTVSLLLFFCSFTENLGTTSPRVMGSLEMWQAPLPKLLGNRPCPPIENTSEGCFHMYLRLHTVLSTPCQVLGTLMEALLQSFLPVSCVHPTEPLHPAHVYGVEGGRVTEERELSFQWQFCLCVCIFPLIPSY